MNNLQTSESSTACKCSTYLKYAGDAPCWSYQAKTEDSKRHSSIWPIHGRGPPFPLRHLGSDKTARRPPQLTAVLRRIKKRPLGVASSTQATKPNLPSVAGGGQARKYYRPLEHACTRTTRRVRSVLNVDDVRLKFRWRKGKGSGTKVSTHQLGGVSTGDRGNRYASEKIGADEGDRIFVIS